MDRNRLIFAYFTIFLLFTAFKKVTPEIDKASSNIAPSIVESDIDTSKIKSDRLQRKIYDIFRDIDDDREEDVNIQSLIKRGRTLVGDCGFLRDRFKIYLSAISIIETCVNIWAVHGNFHELHGWNIFSFLQHHGLKFLRYEQQECNVAYHIFAKI
ncbi:PREDICTED: uncharacterized protein LOC108746825 isoform X1 [Trachymyrmex septentrionalis]|uniref:uncharacterized protein LOC108746825 isoform X1 n=1 Tax=Trachymyrmex septentrionalis TaxID=34720 RepID=UPI00084F59BF|nr:PREDICTED: uncharacterized protein LOC108746825 isoform X1 [Trachymyrmex septentrionalis]